MAGGRASDDELLRLLREAQAAEDAVDRAVEMASYEAPPFDPCPACGEPAENLGECHVCGEEGCLPSDAWAPGMADPCLTLCVRCARSIHVGCAMEDGAGNPRCPACRF